MRKATETYNLQIINPRLAQEWHPTKNDDLTPRDITPNSAKKVWWLCKKNKKHEWPATPNDRSTRGNGCPYCSGKAVCDDNCLAKLNPKLAKEWHATKNGNLTPSNVTPNSNKKVWWICGNKHLWLSAIDKRNKGSGCPYCSGKAVCDDNSLATLNPQLAKEWHPTKNGVLTPRDVTAGSSKKVWWFCKKNHRHDPWKATVSVRRKGAGCPTCRRSSK